MIRLFLITILPMSIGMSLKRWAPAILGRRELAVTPGIYGVIMYLVVTAFLMSVRKRRRL